MKRSVLLSALVLALAASMPACGGGTDAPKDPTDEKKDGETASAGDPIADLKTSVDNIQKEVDSVFEPIRNADATIQGVSDLPKDLKAAKSKADPKKLMAEAAKLVDGGEANLDSVTGLDPDLKTKVQAKFDAVKALVAAIKGLPDKVTALPAKFDELPKKLVAAAPAAAKAAAKAKMPFGVSAEDKKKAEEDVKTLEGFKTTIPTKIDGWKKDITDMPAKAKDLPAKMKAAFK